MFLTESKDPPVEIVAGFLKRFGLANGGMIRCDQGSKLARSEAFGTTMQREHGYVIKPIGADDPAQNRGMESWNDTFAVTFRELLYGAALSAVYCSAALIHVVFLHNCWVHSRISTTLHEAWYGQHPNLRRLCMFGLKICVKHSRKHRAKLDSHDFTGMFIGYSEMMANVRYIDLKLDLVKTCGHVVFDEVWYLSTTQPPAAQLLYDLRLEQ